MGREWGCILDLQGRRRAYIADNSWLGISCRFNFNQKQKLRWQCCRKLSENWGSRRPQFCNGETLTLLSLFTDQDRDVSRSVQYTAHRTILDSSVSGFNTFVCVYSIFLSFFLSLLSRRKYRQEFFNQNSNGCVFKCACAKTPNHQTKQLTKKVLFNHKLQ